MYTVQYTVQKRNFFMITRIVCMLLWYLDVYVLVFKNLDFNKEKLATIVK